MLERVLHRLLRDPVEVRRRLEREAQRRLEARVQLNRGAGDAAHAGERGERETEIAVEADQRREPVRRGTRALEADRDRVGEPPQVLGYAQALLGGAFGELRGEERGHGELLRQAVVQLLADA